MIVCAAVSSSLLAVHSHQRKTILLKLFEKGKSLLNNGNYDQAIEIFSKVAGMLDPSKRNAHVVILARAKAYLAQGDLKNALKDINSGYSDRGN